MNYLYNGVDLPEMPTDDLAMYPNAVIIKDIVENVYHLFLCDQPAMVMKLYNINGVFIQEYLALNDNGICYYPFSTFWSKVVEITNEGAITEGMDAYTVALYKPYIEGLQDESYPNEIVWSNHNILSEDGTVCFTKSDPVPVEADEGEGEGEGELGNSAPFSLKNFLIGIIKELVAEQSPIVTAHPIVGYSYNGVRLAKVPDTRSVGKMYAVIVGGNEGKYHLYLSTEKLNVWKNDESDTNGGLVAATTNTFYMVYGNYSLEDGTILKDWTSHESETLATVGTIEAGTVLEDQFVADGILWSSYALYGDDGELRKSASRIYPATEV